MPRRIVGSANFDVYASLTAKTEKIFFRLFAGIIHKVVDAELRGELRANGIESDASRDCKYWLRARIMLTDDTIIVRATSFSGPDTDDDEDDRNDDQDICEFQFERDRCQWRLVQISGLPLPVPDLVNRAGTPEPTRPTVEPATPIAIDLFTRIASNVTSTLRSLIVATSSDLQKIDGIRRMVKPTIRIFISHSKALHIIRPSNSARLLTESSAFARAQFDAWAETMVAIAVLNSLRNAIRAEVTVDNLIWMRVNSAVTSLLRMEISLSGRLRFMEPDYERVTSALTEQLRRSPVRAEELLFNLMELGAAESAALKLRRANRATWKALIVRPLDELCGNPRSLAKSENLNQYSIVAHNARSSPRRQKAGVQKAGVSEFRAHARATGGHHGPDHCEADKAPH